MMESQLPEISEVSDEEDEEDDAERDTEENAENTSDTVPEGPRASVSEHRPVEGKTRSHPRRRGRRLRHPVYLEEGVSIASNSLTYIPAPETAVELIYPRPETFSISGRFGGGYGALSQSGLWNVGLGLSYALAHRVGIDFRSDFQIPMNEDDVATRLSGIWFSLNMILYLNTMHIVQPYIVTGVLLAVAPGSRALNIESDVAGGGQAGLGIEVLIRQVIGISVEALGFIAGNESSLLEGGITFQTALTWYI